MKLDSYISELLYHHDCVIVPGLGGFVVNYKPAQIDEIKNTFYPPSKSISFNKNLRNNDGLLINHIATHTNKQYNTVDRLIEEHVAEINQALKLKKRFSFTEIGSLYIDRENKLLFEPENKLNYLTDSYGLSVFQKQPIIRTTIEEKITKEFKDRTTPLVAVKEKSNTRKWAIAAAITIPLTFFAIWIPSKYDVGADINYAKLNPFTPDPQPVYQANKNELAFQGSNEKSIKEQLLLANENDVFVEITLDEKNNPVIVQLKQNTVAEPVSTYVASSQKELHYHIVGGCFSSKHNAKKLVKKLQKEGFNASIIGKRKGLWTVSYNSFVTRKEAVAALAQAQSHNDKAWVLNY